MTTYYDKAIQSIEHKILTADPDSESCTNLVNELVRLQIKRKQELDHRTDDPQKSKM